MSKKEKIAIIGAGTMGIGIAHVFALAQMAKEVTLVDLDKDILDNAKKKILNNLNRQLSKELITKEDLFTATKKIKYSIDLSLISGCDLIIEAVKEDLQIKICSSKRIN